MAGHSKWAQIKRQKGAEDAKRAKVFSKLARFISVESKRVNGDVSSPTLRKAIDDAKKENMPKDTIERAIKKGLGSDAGELMEVIYEGYGPGGVALIVRGFTDNKNRTAPAVRHAFSKLGFAMAESGAAMWAFTKTEDGYEPNITVDISEAEGEQLGELIETLEAVEDIEEVFTNAN